MASTYPASFTLHCTDSGTQARRGTLNTPHGPVETPAFMPVGTQGTVKGVDVGRLRETGAQMVLGNTYHLALRPGEATVAALGGLHQFMGWNGPILTDSGGFQIFSLAQSTVGQAFQPDEAARGTSIAGQIRQESLTYVKVDEQGATFQSHIDGATVHVTPERSIEIQQHLGSDVAMVLDHVIGLPAPRELIADAMHRSIRWADRCQAFASREGQSLFAIVQGGLDPELRHECATELVKRDFAGYAIGGLSVGEPPAEMYLAIEATTPALPADRPRYLMGVGRPEDLLEAISRGIDLFDCVMPTRNGRNALAFTKHGPLRLRNLQHAQDDRPLEDDCPCLACRHSRGYLRHLFMSNEMLGPILLSIHNLTFYQRLMAGARAAIEQGKFAQFRTDRLQEMS